MKRQASAVTNGLWNGFSTAVVVLVGIFGSIMIVRDLSPDDYGIFSYYAWLATILTTLGVLAFPVALTKVASELRGQGALREARALAHGMVIFLFGFNALLSIGLILWAFSVEGPQRSYLLIVTAILVPNALTRMFFASSWGDEQYKPVSLVTTFATLAQLALIVVAHLLAWGIAGYLAAVVSTHVISVLVLVLVSPRLVLPRIAKVSAWPSRQIWQRYLAFVTPATLIMLFDTVVWQRSEVFFLGRWSTLEQIGYYSLAFTLSSMFFALGAALISSFLPAISRAYGENDWQAIREKIPQGVLVATLYAVPLSFGGLATLRELITLLYGEKMLPAVPVAYILFVGLFPGVMVCLLAVVISALDRLWIMVYAGSVMAAINIVLNLILIPRLGAFGGALGNVTTQMCCMLFLYFMVRRLWGITLPWRAMAGIVAIGALTTFLLPKTLLAWLPDNFGLVIAIFSSAVCYSILVWAFGYVRHVHSFRRPQENVVRA